MVEKDELEVGAPVIVEAIEVAKSLGRGVVVVQVSDIEVIFGLVESLEVENDRLEIENIHLSGYVEQLQGVLAGYRRIHKRKQ